VERISPKTALAVSLAAIALTFGARAEAQGDDMSRAKEAFSRGQTAFEAGRIEEARAAFEESLAAFPHFRTLFNIGLCAEKLGDVRTAIDMYERYVEWPAEVPNRDDVSKKIAELKGTLPPEPEPPSPEPTAVTPEPTAPPVGAPAQRNGRDLRVPGWIAIGTGVAGMITGGVFLGLAHKRKDEMGVVDGEYYDPAVHDALPEDGERYQTIGWLAGGAGLAIAATGAILLIVSRDKKTESAAPSDTRPPIAVLPLIAPQGVALGAAGSF
jgi:tetratricopeptide (TPR) repeat protein